MEVILFASTLNDMRENLTANMYSEFDVLGKDLNAAVKMKGKQVKRILSALSLKLLFYT